MEKNKDKALVKTRGFDIIKLGNSIDITNKILFTDIEKKFNKAFLKMNSKDQSISKDKNYLLLFETDTHYGIKHKYNYEANKLEDYNIAIGLFSSILNLKPWHVLSLYMKGICKIKLKKFESAIEDLTIAIKIDHKCLSAYNARGVAKKKLNDIEGAIEDLSKAIEIAPNSISYNNRGLIKLKLNEYEAAIEDYSKAIEFDPIFAKAYRNRGFANYKLNDFEVAIEDYSKAIEINPIDANTYNSRGNANSKLNDFEEAIEDYSKAIEINPNAIEAYHNRGIANRKLNNFEDAAMDKKNYETLRNQNHGK